LYGDAHVLVPDGLVADDGHEWREREHDETDGHRRAHGCENNGKHEPAAVPASRAMWNGSIARTRYVYNAKSVSTNTATGTATVSTVAVAPMCASWPM